MNSLLLAQTVSPPKVATPHSLAVTFLPWLLAVALAWPCLNRAQSQLLDNGSFEDGALTGWSQVGGAVPTTEEAHHGHWSLRLTTQNPQTSFATRIGDFYKVTAWIRIAESTGNDQAWGGFRLEIVDSDWTTLAHSGWVRLGSHGDRWFKIALSFAANSPSTRLLVGYFGDSARQMTVLLDDVQAFAKPAVNRAPEITVSFTPTQFDALPSTQSFTVEADDPDGAVRQIYWDFGDGTRSVTGAGTRKVGVPGQFTATVWVSDDDGAVVHQTIPWNVHAPAWPLLTVTDPRMTESTNAAGTLTLAGSVSPADALLTLSTDRDHLAIVAASDSGSWQDHIPLAAGWNRVLIQARAADGKVVIAERRVRFVPTHPLTIADLQEASPQVERWEPLEITFRVAGSAATHLQFPYDPQPPPGLEWIDGINAQAVFTSEDGRTVLRRPAFWHQPYLRADRGGEEWLYPTNSPRWTVRFAPPSIGRWRYHVEAREARGFCRSEQRWFDAVPPTDPLNRGPVGVAPTDRRYFAYADGTTFLGGGHNIGFSAERFSLEAEARFAAIGGGNQQLFRWWIAGHLWGSAWMPWNSRTLGYAGTVPKTGLTLESAYATGLASVRLDAANPILFQGWMSGRAGLVRGQPYRVRIRWRTTGVTGPATDGQPHGVCAKLTGWPEPGQTGSIPLLVPHIAGDSPWHVAWGDFTATTDLMPNLAVILENTTAGAAYIDEVALHPVQADGALGPQLLRSPRMNTHTTFDPRRGAGIDRILQAAARQQLHFQLNISEKQEELLNWLGPDGLPDPLGGHFNQGPGTPTHWLHRAYWRHLFARFGAYRSVHAWELVNEENPNNLTHFRLATDLARDAATDGNPHPASTSTWASFAASSWKHPDTEPLSYVDFHAYVRSTGELGPKEELANDSARFFHEYDLAAHALNFGKPVVWGEQGIDGTGGSDGQDPLLAADETGIWLHKIVWARSGPGAVYPLYWYTDHIFDKALHPRFGSWRRFVHGIPLHNGRYRDLAASATDPNLRVLGQKDPTAGRAHAWVDHRQHTWRTVVDGTPIPPISATVSWAMDRPSASYQLERWDTSLGEIIGSETVSADATGQVAVTVTNLVHDIAVRLRLDIGAAHPPRITNLQRLAQGVRLTWDAEPGQSYRLESRPAFAKGPWVSQPLEIRPDGIWAEIIDSSTPGVSRYYRLAAW